MQALADLLREAQRRGVLTADDLYLDEPHFIGRLLSDPAISARWQDYRRITGTRSAPKRPEGVYAVRVAAKKRSIDPLVRTENGSPALHGHQRRLRHAARRLSLPMILTAGSGQCTNRISMGAALAAPCFYRFPQ